MTVMNQNCLDDCKKFLGLRPYNTSSNIVEGDGYFLQSLFKKYGELEVQRTIKYLNSGLGE